ncbi:MAG: TonB-dependent receptor [Bacteroidota bacterium]
MRKDYKDVMKLSMIAALLFALVAPMYGQGTVTGKVVDAETGDGLPGVSILRKGTSEGTITDFTGNYSISASNTDVLIFSFVGFVAQEVTVGDRSVIDVTLLTDVTSLSEIVVVGYGTSSKEEVTGAVALVPISDAFKIPVTNASEAFQGRIAGVTVVADGEPGNAPLVRIRGYGTPNNNDPLYVIDGMQTNDPNILNNIAPGDIESISVLKDASVSSIYGARAANGVIVVTTKKGNANKTEFTFDAFYGTQRAADIPELLNAEQWSNLIGDGTVPEFLGSGNPSQPYSFENNRITPVAPAGTDWYDQIFDNAAVQNYYLSARGGSERGRYMMSASYMDKEGVLLNTGFERFTGRMNTEFNITDKLRVGEHLNVSFGKQKPTPGVDGDDNPIALAYRINPLIPVRDAGGNFAGSGVDASNLGNAANPVASLERAAFAGNLNRTFRAFGDAYLEYDIIENLTFKSSIGIDYISGDSRSFTAVNPEHSEPVTINNLLETNFTNSDWVWNNTLTYDLKLSDVHNLNVLVGTESIGSDSDQSQVRQNDFFREDEDFVVIGAGTGSVEIPSGGSFRQSSNLFSVFGRINYDYEGKYLASVTLRNDRTSRFNDGNNSDVFPALSAGWVASRESFMESIRFINNLKLRASWGRMGNQSLPRANPTFDVLGFDQTLTAYDLSGDGNSSAGLVTVAVGNPDLTWEISTQTNAGLDIGILQGDLTLSFDYFNIETEGTLLNPRPAGLASTITPAYQNIGDIRNRGFDFSIEYGNYSKQSGLQYDFAFNISTYDNEVTAINSEDADFFVGSQIRTNTFTRMDVGNPISYFYGREVIGIFQNETEVANSPDQGFESPADGVGRFKYRDVDGNGVISDDDRTFIGSPHPDFTFGFNANLAYKGFDIAIFFNGSLGNDIYNYSKVFTDFSSVPNGNRSTRVLDSWTPSNPGAELPQFNATQIVNNEGNPNSYFVEDGSFVRLKNLQLGYSLPEQLISSTGLSNVRFYVQGTNLVTITDYEGLDPEIGARPNQTNGNLNLGIDYGRFPLARTYTVGVTVSF